MATYVFSDVHGHAAPLARALERTEPSEGDAYYCLGDMIDRGPDPLGVISLVRGLPGSHVLMGNHEDLMMACMRDPDNTLNAANWGMNGGIVTSEALASLSEEEADEVVAWVAGLPPCAHVEVAGRRYILTHAGIDPARVGEGPWDTPEQIDALLCAQRPDDLMWIREDFWSRHTGLIDEKGEGPVVIAGHTPTPYLGMVTGEGTDLGRDAEGRACLVRLGADGSTGGVADRWDIDAGAAGGHGFGRVLVLRLDDGREFYEEIGPDE